MKASHIAVVALGAAVMAAFLAYPAFATASSTNTSSTTSSSSAAGASSGAATPPMPGPMHRIAAFFRGGGFGPFGGGRGGRGQAQATTFTTGQTITLTSTAGSYFVAGTQGKTNGTASGTLTFTVGGKLTAGYILSVGGTITVNGTTYNVSSGSAVMGPGGANIQGEGATSSSGSYIVRATARGDFSGTTTATVSLDFSNGTTEYVVSLTSTITG
jgi:hypothetical protein